MTFCVGMRLKEGILAVADTQLTSGDVDYVVSSKKVFTFENKTHSMFLMLSGLKSISDMVITYLNDKEDILFSAEKLYQGVDFVSKIVREIREREEVWLGKSDISFEINYLIGGQFPGDKNPQLFHVYSEGSWKRVTKDSPFEIIGEGKYGKPILDRGLKYNTAKDRALLLGLLAFDSTQKSYPLCNPPLDVIYYENDRYKFKQFRLKEQDVINVSKKWDKEIGRSVANIAKHKWDFIRL